SAGAKTSYAVRTKGILPCMPHYIRQTPDALIDDAPQVRQVIIDNPAVDDGAGRDEDVVDVAESLKHLPDGHLIGDICSDGAHLTQLALCLRQLVLRTAGDGDIRAGLPCQPGGGQANAGTAPHHHDMCTLKFHHALLVYLTYNCLLAQRRIAQQWPSR